MKSTRLPGKVLRDICGQTMLSRVLHRARNASFLNDIIIATSVDTIDDAIVDECRRLGASFFRGDENDVLDRYYQAALSSEADVVVRITADCPLIDPTIIDKVVRRFLRSRPDYASNTLMRTYPRGLDVEVMKTSALAAAWRHATKPYQRAHVTPYIYENPSLFQLLSVHGKKDYSCYRWTVDTPEDLEFVTRVYQQFERKKLFGWREVLKLCVRNPELTTLNSQIKQKKLREC